MLMNHSQKAEYPHILKKRMCILSWLQILIYINYFSITYTTTIHLNSFLSDKQRRGHFCGSFLFNYSIKVTQALQYSVGVPQVASMQPNHQNSGHCKNERQFIWLGIDIAFQHFQLDVLHLSKHLHSKSNQC